MPKRLLTLLLANAVGCAVAAPVTYKIDPSQTYPSFEANLMGGLSVWRGKFGKTEGSVVFDKVAGKGRVEIIVDMDSLDFGHEKMNDYAKKPDVFHVAKYPKATYSGALAGFEAGKPTRVDGTLTLHGVTKPLTLKINTFNCKAHPMTKKESCNADAIATFKRDEFGVDTGKAWGFNMDVILRIQVEAGIK